MKKIFFIAFAFLGACNQMQNTAVKDESLSIMQTDKDFSALSGQKGMRFAFFQYIDTTCVLLRADHDPLKGVRAEQFLELINDSLFTITWQPETAIISNSNDLGYSYGKYLLQPRDTSAAEQGTYVTIWKKQPDGKWKFVLDSGNPGLSKK